MPIALNPASGVADLVVLASVGAVFGRGVFGDHSVKVCAIIRLKNRPKNYSWGFPTTDLSVLERRRSNGRQIH